MRESKNKGPQGRKSMHRIGRWKLATSHMLLVSFLGKRCMKLRTEISNCLLLTQTGPCLGSVVATVSASTPRAAENAVETPG